MIYILDDRKFSILIEIVESFIATDEPVGSKVISEKPSIGVSSATVRNEMRDLEDFGYLTKAHHSSGRIPSDKAYRLYVDHLMDLKSLLISNDYVSNITSLVQDSRTDNSSILEVSSSLLAQMTSYTTFIISSVDHQSMLRYIQIDQVSTNKLLIVLIDDSDRSTSNLIYYDGFDTDKDVEIFQEMIRKHLLYKDIEQIKISMDNFNEEYDHYILINKIYKSAISFLKSFEDQKVYSSGLSHVMNFWDEDTDTIRNMINYLEDPDNLKDIADLSKEDLSIRIGVENKNEILKDASIISAKYDTSDIMSGSISIIGPTRMDYKYLIQIILGMSNTIEKVENLFKR